MEPTISNFATLDDGRELYVTRGESRQRTGQVRMWCPDGGPYVRQVRGIAVRVRSKHALPGVGVYRVYGLDAECRRTREPIGWLACYLHGNVCTDMTPGWYWRSSTMQTLHRVPDVPIEGVSRVYQFMGDALRSVLRHWGQQQGLEELPRA